MPGGAGWHRLAHAGVAAFRTYAVQSAGARHCARASAGTKTGERLRTARSIGIDAQHHYFFAA
jgi:hypothetical protein